MILEHDPYLVTYKEGTYQRRKTRLFYDLRKALNYKEYLRKEKNIWGAEIWRQL
jgi:hypothetical protein